MATSTIPLSTEPPSTLKQNLSPVKLRYIPISGPVALPPDHELITRTATADSPYPCRRCLQDASPGEKLHLISYDPFPSDSVTPYRGDGPIFIHAHDCKPFDEEKLPERQLRRLMAVRAYDEKHMMAASAVVKGEELEGVVGGMLADERAAYVNVHNALPGCFAFTVKRAE